MRIAIAVAVGIVAACLILFVASPFGGRVALPPVTATVQQVHAKVFIPAGTTIDPQVHLKASANTQASQPQRHVLEVPQGTLPGVILEQYRGYVVANDIRPDTQIYAHQLMPPATANRVQSNVQIHTFARQYKAGTPVDRSMFSSQNQPNPWNFREILNSSDRRFHNSYGIYNTFQNQVLAVDVEPNMPVMEHMFMPKAEFDRMEQARADRTPLISGTTPSPAPAASKPAILRWSRDYAAGSTIRSRTAFRFDNNYSTAPAGARFVTGNDERIRVWSEFDGKTLSRSVSRNDLVKAEDFK